MNAAFSEFSEKTQSVDGRGSIMLIIVTDLSANPKRATHYIRKFPSSTWINQRVGVDFSLCVFTSFTDFWRLQSTNLQSRAKYLT